MNSLVPSALRQRRGASSAAEDGQGGGTRESVAQECPEAPPSRLARQARTTQQATTAVMVDWRPRLEEFSGPQALE